jgi:hypothetical protein
MRCPHCDNENPEGAARCLNCDTPLTAYAGQATGEVSAATLQKLSRLSQQPPIVPIVVALDVLIAIFGPFGFVLSRFLSRTVTNAEGTNYLGAAFGAVGVAFTALLMVPLGLFLIYVAWLTWNRGSWAWLANAALLCGMAALCLFGFFTPWVFFRLLGLAVFAAAAWAWFRTDTREWFGA